MPVLKQLFVTANGEYGRENRGPFTSVSLKTQ